MLGLLSSCLFDWYQATVNDKPQAVIDWLLREYPDASIKTAKPKNGASNAMQLCRGDCVLVQFIWGGGMPEGLINIWASGSDAHLFAKHMRRRYPLTHRVTRADCAVNFDGVGAWEFYSNWGLALSDKHKIKVEHVGDFHRGESGRTLYIGSKHSVVRLVIYEKGKQIPEIGLPNMVRVELRVSPGDRESGINVGMLKPQDLYKCSSWSLEAGEFLFSEQGWERVVIGTKWNKSDAERARSAFLKQYSGILGEWMSELGGWDALGAEIGSRILKASEEKQNSLERLKSVSKVAQATAKRIDDKKASNGGMGAIAPHKDAMVA